MGARLLAPACPAGPSLLSRPELLDGSDQVGAVRLAHPLKHSVGSVLSELLAERARKRLLLRFAALKGRVGHVFSGTGAAQVGFGRGCGALHPLIPELLNTAGQRRWAACLGLWREWLRDFRRGRLRDCRGGGGGGGGGRPRKKGEKRQPQRLALFHEAQSPPSIKHFFRAPGVV